MYHWKYINMQIYAYNVAKQLIATALRKVSLAHKKVTNTRGLLLSTYVWKSTSYTQD